MLQKPSNSSKLFKLLSRMGCLSIPFLGILAISRFPLYFCIDMCPHHANTEAVNQLGLINRSQADYFLNSSVFATSFEDLKNGFTSETKHYRYKILQTTSQTNYTFALAKDKKLYNYISAVFVTKNSQGEEKIIDVICGLDKPSLVELALPFIENQQATCSPKQSWQLGERR
jgi:hypothetical protein